ncbi:SdrD B-like domain-containing protein [Pseudorhodoferax sp.]|uniref:SdrD B-like domain-containing protein n=1 Tax=Pseudorhodoferax sp. TaxID=1993553 RepID=UPI002DD698CC|nr:SdrD B-like domain-containing protein [Pseudorhodoferax sp.]
MAAPNNLTTTVEVCEDTNKAFGLVELLAAAGYVPTAPVNVERVLVTNPDGTVSVAPTSLVQIAANGTGLVITASNEANWFGALSALNLVVEQGSQTFTVRVNVNVLPVNDAPEGTNRAIALTDGAGYVLKEADFGFRDPVEGDHFKSVVVTSLPATGQLTLRGVALVAGAEVSVQDIRAGALVYTPRAAAAGTAGFDFQVRDDGGTANCNAADLDATPNRITFEPQAGCLGDRVWNDTNRNGVQDAGETGVAGVAVTLAGAGADGVFGTADDTGRTTTTNSTGNYLFSNLAAGQYRVTFGAVAGHDFTTANAGSNDAADSDVNASGVSHTVKLAIGQSNLTVDAGVVQRDTNTACLGDRVWNDTNRNGVQDTGETGVAGVTVTLAGAGADGVFGTADDTSRTTTTNSTGNYLFSNLAAGQYRVTFGAVAGHDFTTANAGSNDAADSDVNASGVSHTVTLAIGQSNLTVDAGVVQRDTNTACLGDRVWNDNNRNGVQDTGETGVAGVTVTLAGAGADGVFGTADDISRTTTTNSTGNYLFSNLAAGQYRVTFGAVAGHDFTAANAGSNDATDSDANASGVSHTVTLAIGQSNLTVDAGVVQRDTNTAKLGDRLWNDADRDGIQDTGETGVAGVTVTLAGAGADSVFGTADDTSRTTTTNSTGNYLFSNLAAGQYRVTFGAVAGHDFTTANAGSNDATDSDVNASGVSHTVTLAIGQSDLTVDAGIVQRTGAIGDFVWFDYGSGASNHNNLQDSNETTTPYLVVNTKVELHDAATGALLQTTYTGTDGKYLFTGVNAGNYYLTFDNTNATFYSSYYGRYESAAGQSYVTKDVGTDDTRDSDVYNSGPLLGRTDSFYLAQGQIDLTRDFGITPIVLDLDGNGIQTVARQASDASFDLFGNGSPVQSGWISGGDGFLAVDGNGNGRIDDIGELFGGNAKGAGFAKLASFDSNGDGLVDSRDAAFGELRVWVDADGNRQTDAGELRTLAEAGIAALTVDYVEQPFLDAQGNLHLERSSASLADGSVVDMTDVYFNVDAADALAAGVALPTMGELLGVDDGLLQQAFGPGSFSGQVGWAGSDLGIDAAAQAQRAIAEAMKHAEASLSVGC